MTRDDDRLLLSDLRGMPVLEDDVRIGYVVDVRFVLDGPPGTLVAGARVLGIIVGPHARLGFMGYERRDMRAPALLARALRRREHGAHLIGMEDVLELGRGHIRVRPGHRRWSTELER